MLRQSTWLWKSGVMMSSALWTAWLTWKAWWSCDVIKAPSVQPAFVWFSGSPVFQKVRVPIRTFLIGHDLPRHRRTSDCPGLDLRLAAGGLVPENGAKIWISHPGLQRGESDCVWRASSKFMVVFESLVWRFNQSSWKFPTTLCRV